MAETSAISWTDATFNPWVGCTRVSEGCRNCYAEADFDKRKGFAKWGPQGTRVVKAEAGWREPLKWNKAAEAAGVRKRVFCASLADVFEDWTGPMSVADRRVLTKPYLDAESQPANWQAEDADVMRADPHGWRLVTMGDVRRRLLDLICRTPNLDWLLLTKRPENAARMMVEAGLYASTNPALPCPQPNLWIGTSVENQAAADERIPHLLATPAAVRFLSCEPLLGPVELVERFTDQPPARRDYLTGQFLDMTADMVDGSTALVSTSEPSLPKLHWVIVGGESGPGARPMAVEWARGLVAQCKAASVPVFVKQMGAAPTLGLRLLGAHDTEEGAFPRCARCGHFDFGPCSDGTLLCNGCNTPWGGLKDKKGGEPAEWPADLRVREFPQEAA